MILETIRRLYPQLTRSQKRLADFIAVSYQEAAFMTASRLARRLALNEATVIRFAQRLGYSGYPDLIRDVQAIVQRELGAKAGSAGLAHKDPFVALLNAEVDNLQRVVGHISPETAHAALAMLQQAGKVYILGQGIGVPLAQAFGLSLRSLGVPAESPLADPLNLATMLAEIDQECVVVAVSPTAESQEIANALSLAHERGARTLALTWSPVWPCAQAADLAISCPTSDPFVVPSITPIAMLIDALVQSLGSRDIERMQALTEKSAQALEAIAAERSR